MALPTRCSRRGTPTASTCGSSRRRLRAGLAVARHDVVRPRGDLRPVLRGAEEGRAEPAPSGERRGSGSREAPRREVAAVGRGRGWQQAAGRARRLPRIRRRAARARRARRSPSRSTSTACSSASSRCPAFPSGSTASSRPARRAPSTTSRPAAGGGRGGAGGGATLHRYRLSDRRAAPFVTGVAEYDVSADGRKLLYRTGGGAGGRGAWRRRRPSGATCSWSTRIARRRRPVRAGSTCRCGCISSHARSSSRSSAKAGATSATTST